MERIFTPPPIVSYVRCVKCGRRYPAIGLGGHRIVVREKTKGNTWIAAATVFFMGLVFLAVSYYAYRNFGPN